MPEPLISVLMPVRNGMPYLVAAVDSFLAQDWPAKQLIIVDGESVDEGAAYLAALNVPNIHVFCGPDGGATEALNFAASLAAGEIIGLLMSDDLLEEGALSAVAQVFSDGESTAMVAGTVSVFDNESSKMVTVVAAGEQPLNLDRILGTPYCAAFYIATPLWRKLNGFDQTFKYGADRDFLMRAWIAAASVRGLQQHIYAYRRHDRSDTLGGNEGPIVDFLNDHLIMAQRWLALTTDEIARRSILSWRRKEAIALTRLYIKHRDYRKLARLLTDQLRIDPILPIQCGVVVLRNWIGLIRRKFILAPRVS